MHVCWSVRVLPSKRILLGLVWSLVMCWRSAILQAERVFLLKCFWSMHNYIFTIFSTNLFLPTYYSGYLSVYLVYLSTYTSHVCVLAITRTKKQTECVCASPLEILAPHWLLQSSLISHLQNSDIQAALDPLHVATGDGDVLEQCTVSSFGLYWSIWKPTRK